MIRSRFLTFALCLSAVLWAKDQSLAGFATMMVARKGQAAPVSSTWPAGVGDLVNDPSRTSGWNSSFSEWPNDVNQYSLEIKSTEKLNRLIIKLSAIKTKVRQIHLSYQKEPAGLGWVTRLPEGNGIPVIFSIGDQSQIDAWYMNVRQQFGVMKFTKASEAVPPTLTIFVQNRSVDLDKLKIPKGIDVSIGCVPTVFHKSNTTLEREYEKIAASRNVEEDRKKLKQKLDDSALSVFKDIETFLKSRTGK